MPCYGRATIRAWSRRTLWLAAFQSMSCHPSTISWEAAPVCSTVICFASLVGLPNSPVMRDRVEVCTLSRGMMLPALAQFLSPPLQGGLRFIHILVPTPLSAFLAGGFPYSGEIWAYHVPSQCLSGLGPTLSAGSFDVHDRRGRTSCTSSMPILGQAYQHLWLVQHHDV